MKILAIHNYHRKGSASGDDQVFNSETELLRQHGNEVVTYTVRNDEFDNAGIIGKLKATLGMLWSFKNYNAVKSLIEKEKPEIVHIHTFFPLLSPSILYAAKRCGVKVVATLHDTRFVCPCATSLRGTTLCNSCGDGHYFRMCKYGCFKNSKFQSLIVAFIFKYHRIRKSFYKQIDKYVCLNDNQIKLLENIGFEKNKIIKKYNFVPDAEANLKAVTVEKLPKRYAVFYGRIGEEKGIRILMKVWSKLENIPLVVMGSGPLEEEFKIWADKQDNVYYMGYVQHDKCLSIVKGGEFVVFPSIWYEGCSMVEIETESLGKGLVATDLGFSEEAIENGVNGYKVSLGDVDGFVKVIEKLWNDPEKCKLVGKNARADYENKYLPEDNYNQLMDIYNSVRK
nr:glycosyltransferase [uncultured Ruminococcus sp.]